MNFSYGLACLHVLMSKLEREKDKGRERERERERVCVCECVRACIRA